MAAALRVASHPLPPSVPTVLQYMSSYLGTRSLLVATQCNREWMLAFGSDLIWRDLCVRRWRDKPPMQLYVCVAQDGQSPPPQQLLQLPIPTAEPRLVMRMLRRLKRAQLQPGVCVCPEQCLWKQAFLKVTLLSPAYIRG